MAKEPRKPLRERVAERKRLEAEKARGAGAPVVGKGKSQDVPEGEEAVKRALSAVWWRRIEMGGSVLQWAALLALIIEIYFLWSADGETETRWSWIIVYAVIFGVGRVVKTLGDAQTKRFR